MSTPLDRLQSRLGHVFRNVELLESALTHSSFCAEHPESQNNQRLEFLGDAVLQILIAEALYQALPQDREGSLSQRRSLLVNESFLAGLAKEIGADSCIRLGRSEVNNAGHNRPSILGDSFEAIVGAVYLDSDFMTTRRVVMAIYGNLLERLGSSAAEDNPKGRLQEIVQPKHGNQALRYEVTSIEGQDHARVFNVEVFFKERSLGTGRGLTKKTAEEAAAREGLLKLASGDSS